MVHLVQVLGKFEGKILDSMKKKMLYRCTSVPLFSFVPVMANMFGLAGTRILNDSRPGSLRMLEGSNIHNRHSAS